MALKSTELRIGNLILDHKGEIKTVTAYDLINLSDMEKKLHHDPRCKDWKGIFLEEDWLSKFGFEKHEMGWFWKSWGTNGVEIIQWNISYRQYVYSLGKARFKAVQFVHELQNIYGVLTGAELEVKL